MLNAQLTFWPDDRVGQLNWSFSRDRKFRTCLRQYYLHYYASREGDKPGSPPAARNLYVLRHLKSRHMWLGEIAHELIETALSAFRRGENPAIDELIGRGRKRMQAQYAESARGLYRQRPGAACGLTEHEYRDPVPRGEWQALRDRLEQSLRSFAALDLVETIRKTPASRWLALESMGSFSVPGARVMAKPDVAFRDEQNRIVLVDWKTGGHAEITDDHRLQLAIYAHFARTHWALGQEPIVAAIAFVGTGQVEQWLVEDEACQRALSLIAESVEAMRSRGEGRAGGPPAAEQFPLTEDLRTCAHCVFRRPCGR